MIKKVILYKIFVRIIAVYTIYSDIMGILAVIVLSSQEVIGEEKFLFPVTIIISAISAIAAFALLLKLKEWARRILIWTYALSVIIMIYSFALPLLWGHLVIYRSFEYKNLVVLSIYIFITYFLTRKNVIEVTKMKKEPGDVSQRDTLG